MQPGEGSHAQHVRKPRFAQHLQELRTSRSRISRMRMPGPGRKRRDRIDKLSGLVRSRASQIPAVGMLVLGEVRVVAIEKTGCGGMPSAKSGVRTFAEHHVVSIQQVGPERWSNDGETVARALAAANGKGAPTRKTSAGKSGERPACCAQFHVWLASQFSGAPTIMFPKNSIPASNGQMSSMGSDPRHQEPSGPSVEVGTLGAWPVPADSIHTCGQTTAAVIGPYVADARFAGLMGC